MARRSWLPDTPLTNPRSLLSSVAFHATLLLLASLVVLTAVIPDSAKPNRVMRAEIGLVDNRVLEGEGGGGPGELGSARGAVSIPLMADGEQVEALASVERPALDLPGVEPAGILPSDPLVGANPAVGDAPGPVGGGGGGTGGGVGGGVGSGVGSRTEFFGVPETASSYAYVIDRSGSMSQNRAIDLACRELLSSVSRLEPEVPFGVIVYNHESMWLTSGRAGDVLSPATAENVERLRTWLASVQASGGTDHNRALRAAFASGAEVVYFLTDARQMTPEDAEALRAEAGASRVHAIMFGVGPAPRISDPLEKLAASTGGAYRYIDVLSRTKPAH